MSTVPLQMVHFFFLGGGVTAFPVHCSDMFITQKCHIFKNEEVLRGPPLNITNIF